MVSWVYELGAQAEMMDGSQSNARAVNFGVAARRQVTALFPSVGIAALFRDAATGQDPRKRTGEGILEPDASPAVASPHILDGKLARRAWARRTGVSALRAGARFPGWSVVGIGPLTLFWFAFPLEPPYRVG